MHMNTSMPKTAIKRKMYNPSGSLFICPQILKVQVTANAVAVNLNFTVSLRFRYLAMDLMFEKKRQPK